MSVGTCDVDALENADPVCSQANTRVNDNFNFDRTHLNRKILKHKECWFYMNGYCRYGRNCKFNHLGLTITKSVPAENVDVKPSTLTNAETVNNDFAVSKEQSGRKTSLDEVVGMEPKSSYRNHNSNSKMYQPKRICRFFKEGICRKGDNCTFRHSFGKNVLEKANKEIGLGKLKQSTELMVPKDRYLEKIPNTPNAIRNAKLPLCINQLNDEDLHHLRETEIEQLKKRYPRMKCSNNDLVDTFQFVFYPSDPDWAFVVKTVVLEVSLPKLYPKQACEIKVLEDEKVFMPTLLLRFLNNCIKEWLLEKHEACAASGKVELIIRAFLRWLDRNLEQNFICGLKKVKQDAEAKKAGIDFVPYEMLPGATAISSPTNLLRCEEQTQLREFIESDLNTGEPELTAVEAKEPCIQNENLVTNNDENLRCEKNMKLSNEVPKRGTELRLVHFELKDAASALSCQNIALSVQCCRCKIRHEMSTPAKQRNLVSCIKCHQAMEITFYSSLLHPQSSVLGYLQLWDCLVVDVALMKCHFFIDCLNCVKQNSIQGIHYGQPYGTWCLFCNQKLSVLVSSVKFLQLLPPEKIGNTVGHHSTGKKSIKKDSVIKEGKPLPDFGICKHYKKSHRWLRFPCCGKSYPCDLCHNEYEAGHEMKYANRMICGFCAKEQPYSRDKPCVLCSFSMTKKSGPHWEGGKGCRDRITMSRDDKQKYAGMNKTVSGKSKDRKKGK